MSDRELTDKELRLHAETLLSRNLVDLYKFKERAEAAEAKLSAVTDINTRADTLAADADRALGFLYPHTASHVNVGEAFEILRDAVTRYRAAPAQPATPRCFRCRCVGGGDAGHWAGEPGCTRAQPATTGDMLCSCGSGKRFVDCSCTAQPATATKENDDGE